MPMVGASFTIADIALFAYTHCASDGGFDLGRYPNVRAWIARCLDQPGMSAMPPLTIPWFGEPIVLFADVGLYYVVLGMLVVVYLGLRILMNSAFGNVIVAIRENPERAEMLGYDIRRYQLITFVIGAALAGLSGVLYTAWGQYITPSSMGMTAAALPLLGRAVPRASTTTPPGFGATAGSGSLTTSGAMAMSAVTNANAAQAKGRSQTAAGLRPAVKRSS